MEADPTHSGALTDLGNLWLRAGSLDDAITYYQRALALVGPQHENNQASALHNLGQVYKQVCSGCHRGSVVDGMVGALTCVRMWRCLFQQHRHEESIAVLQALADRRPRDMLTRASLLAARAAACDWRGEDEFHVLWHHTQLYVERLERKWAAAADHVRDGANTPEGDEAASPTTIVNRHSTIFEGLLVFEALRLPVQPLWLRRLATAVSSMYDVGPPPTPFHHDVGTTLARSTSGLTATLRVAYVSYDFRDHPTAFLMHRLFAVHNRSRIEVQCFHYGPAAAVSSAEAGGSRGETFTQRIARLCDTWVHAEGATATELAAQIRERRPHVLVDLMVQTRGAMQETIAQKPAPIIVNYLGCPCTSGGRTTDYALVDVGVLPPEARDVFSEARVYVDS